MGILQVHIPFYNEIFEIPDFFSEPVLVFGFQEIRVKPTLFAPWSSLSLGGKWKKLRRRVRGRWKALLNQPDSELAIPEAYRARDIVEFLDRRGVKDVRVLDLFDPRSSLRHDMNHPVPAGEHERYGTFIDIGCLEHVFDTRQCLENCLRMVRVGGVYFLVTCVNGYFTHGLHVFNPEGLLKALTHNGFEIVYCRYSTNRGAPIDDPSASPEVLIWLVARKLRSIGDFVIPQQGLWDAYYDRLG